MEDAYTTFDPSDAMVRLMQLMEKQTIAGEGAIDFKSIISQLDHSAIEQLVIESDFPPEPMTYAEQNIHNLEQILPEL